MIKIKNSNKRRILALTMAIITIVIFSLSLTACGGYGGSSDSATISAQTKNESNIAFVARVIASNENLKLRFLAGSRGYDISPKPGEDELQDIESFDVKGDDAVGVAAGIAVMNTILEKFKFELSEDKALFEEYKSSLTISSMKQIVSEDSFSQE